MELNNLEDIESLGWENIIKNDSGGINCDIIEKDRWVEPARYTLSTTATYLSLLIYITKTIPNTFGSPTETIFKRRIKNKSELKKLMQQLNINNKQHE